MKNQLTLLGIETSCDETAAAIVTSDRQILSNVIRSQIDEHTPYGGVVPELASRSHIKFLDSIIEKALVDAKLGLNEIDGIAVTAGPGLIGGVIVGVMQAKALASALQKPFLAVNHLEGHALTVRMTDDIEFPYLLLLVSGGHCQLLHVKNLGEYELLGQTLDDAVGESFDKVAKMLGLGIPGGPKVEELAKNGDADAFALPRPLMGREGCDFSFSGLKTAVKKVVDEGKISKEDICATFQKAAAEAIEDRVRNALKMVDVEQLVVAGGVAANKYIRTKLEDISQENNLKFVAPPIGLCTDNAAMIAWVGVEKMRAGKIDELDFKPRARWPLAG